MSDTRIKKVTVEKFEAAGKLFDTFEDAQRYTAMSALQEFARESGIGRGGHWSAHMVASSIADHSLELEKILRELNHANGE